MTGHTTSGIRKDSWRSGGSRRGEGGYVALLTVVMLVVLCIMAAFTIDVGNWYVTSQQNQRAADAAALAGVTFMPSDFDDASTAALDMAKRNGLAPGADVTVTPAKVLDQNSRLQVTVTRTVQNAFGGLFGVDETTISRSAIAAFTGPVPMGSPCNEFGNDPDAVPNVKKSENCSDVGQFWANVGSRRADKKSGDAFQNGHCSKNSPTYDGCAYGNNTEYDENGYFYTLTVKANMPKVTVEAFDPAFVAQGDTCGKGDDKDKNKQNDKDKDDADDFFGAGATASVNAKNSKVFAASSDAYLAGESDTPAGRYAAGAASAYCTGDVPFSDPDTAPDTTFMVRKPVPTTYPWDPTSYSPVTGCTRRFEGYAGPIYDKVNQWQQDPAPSSSGRSDVRYVAGQRVPASGYDAKLAEVFRQWTPLCVMTNVQRGTYLIQVQTNGGDDNPDGNGHNRFALRAYGASATQNASLAVAGYTKMAIFANLPSAITQFHLAQVPPSARGQVLNIRLFDIGDSSNVGHVTIVPPLDSGLTTFPTCIGSGPREGPLAGCSIETNASDFQGRWQVVAIPLPSTYSCSSALATGCWVKLQFKYGSGNQPSDTTSWQASIGGDPVRLVK